MVFLPKSLVSGYSRYMVPTCPVEIDWSHPLSEGLVIYYMPCNGYFGDIAENGPILSVPATGFSTGTNSFGGCINSSISSGAVNSSYSPINLTTAGTLMWVGNNIAASVSATYCATPSMSIYSTPPSGQYFPDFYYGYGNTFGRYNITGTNYYTGIATNYPYNYSTVKSMAVTFVVGGTCFAYVNGNYYGVNNPYYGSSPPVWNTSNGITLASPNYSSNAMMLWNRALSATEINQISNVPFSILKPKRSRIYYFPTQPSSRNSAVFPGNTSIYNPGASGFNVPILDSSGNPTSTYVDMESIYVRKELFFNSAIWSCGYNLEGQLGNSTNVNSSSPVQTGGSYNWKQISTFYHHTSMIKNDGSLWACGYNELGQLGNGVTTAASVGYSSPVQIGSLTNWKQISVGQYFTSSIKNDGSLWMWGRNDQGQLGNGTTVVGYSSPIQVGSLTNWKQISSGTSFSNAIKTDGTLWSWGQNNGGTIGNSTASSYSSPIQIGTLTNWAFVSSGNSVAAIKIDGSLWTWGQNVYGQLGNGTTVVGYSSPIQIGNLINWKQVSVNQYHVAAIKTDGTLWAWGNNSNGQLGNGTSISYSSPIQVGSLTNWKQVSAGWYHTSAVKTNGTLWTVGFNNYGQLGNGTIINYSSPVQVGTLLTWKQVASGGYHTAMISTPDLFT